MVALAILGTQAALATVILDTTVTGTFNPYAGSTNTVGNDIPGKPSTLYFGQLQATTSGTADFYYIGNEAGYTNTFLYGDSGTLLSGTGSVSTSGKKDNFNAPYPLLGSISASAGSFLDFSFCTSGGSDVGAFGKCAQNDNAASLTAQYNYLGVGGYRSIAFVPLCSFSTTSALSFDPACTGSSNLWALFWDDAGGRNDDNHDDMIIVMEFHDLAPAIVSVPEPATLALFAVALMGSLVVVGRQQKAARSRH